MSQKQDNPIIVLDIGSAHTRVLAADLNEGALRYLGHGMVESAGMRKGLIAELAPAAKAVRAANEQAERMARVNIEECVVGVGGPHIRGLNTKGIFDPVGMVGVRLEVDLHIATCSGSALQSTVTCANRAGLEVSEAVLESIAAAEATLSADERELGVCLLDIGAHSSDLAVFFEGAVAHTASVPIGGAHFTNDLAVCLQMPVAQAEELKREYGHAVVTAVPEEAALEFSNPQPRILQLRTIAEILEPRARELLSFVRESLRQGGVVDALGAGCVLTGGGALLPGMLDVTESQLRVPARMGTPVRLSHMPAELVHPGFATAIGMLLYAHRTRVTRAAENYGLRSKLRAIFAASY